MESINIGILKQRRSTTIGRQNVAEVTYCTGGKKADYTDSMRG